MNNLAFRFPGDSFVQLPVASAVTDYVRSDRRMGISLYLGGAVGAVLIGVGAGSRQPLLVLVGLLAMLFTFVLAIRVLRQQKMRVRRSRFPRARRVRGGMIRVSGVHAAFLQAVEMQSRSGDEVPPGPS